MNKAKHALVLAFLFLVAVSITPSHAEEAYRVELEPEYLMFEDDDDTEITAYGLTGRFFFWPVKIGDHPYAEDAFLERIGSVELFIGQSKVEDGGVEGDGPGYGAKLIYMRPGSPIFFQAEYFQSELSFDDDVEIEDKAYALQLGWFFGKGFRVALGYENDQIDVTVPFFGDATLESDRYSLLTKYVHELEDGKAFNLEGIVGLTQFDDGTDDGSNTDITILGDYYFTRSLSLGAGFGINQGDDEDEEGKSFLVRGNAFITPKVGLRASYEKFSADGDAGVDDDAIFVALLVRI